MKAKIRPCTLGHSNAPHRTHHVILLPRKTFRERVDGNTVTRLHMQTMLFIGERMTALSQKTVSYHRVPGYSGFICGWCGADNGASYDDWRCGQCGRT